MQKAVITLMAIATIAFAFLFFQSSPAMKNTTLPQSNPQPSGDSITPASSKLDFATFGSGCFWCTEAIFQQLNGVVSVTSGYTGGSLDNPTYRDVCNGTTGHAEVIHLQFDPNIITFTELLEVFWKTHDPTTINQQGNDRGTQYRSAVFFHSPEQKALAEEYKSKLDQSGAFNKPIVTEITAFSRFYPAENYHQNYFHENGKEPYCNYVIQPKMEKFKQVFQSKLKKTQRPS